MKVFLYYSLLWVLAVPATQAQVFGRYEAPIPTPLHLVLLPDSVHRAFNEDSVIAKAMWTPDTVLRRGKSTTIAVFASMIVPGAGQIYNTSYWKAPVVWGLEYYFIYVYRQQNKLYQQYRKEYAASIDSLQPAGIKHLKDNRDFYQRQRDTFGWYVVIAYVVNLLDAYVDASLYNFEVSSSLQPTNELRATVRIHF